MNNVKFYTKLSCLLLISGCLFSSDDPGALIDSNMPAGNDDIGSLHSAVLVDDPDNGSGSDVALGSGNASGDEQVSGESTGSGSSDDIAGRQSTESDESDDVVGETAKKLWQTAREKIERYPYTTAAGVATLALGGLYKFHKPFRTKVNNARDTIKKKVQEFWQKQQREPLTVGFVAKTAVALGAVYCAGKARVVPTLATPFIQSGNYIASLHLSQKCVLGVGVATTALAVSWAYNKFAKKHQIADAKPVPAVTQ